MEKPEVSPILPPENMQAYLMPITALNYRAHESQKLFFDILNI